MQMLRGADGYEMTCRLWRGKESEPVILYIHGIEGHSQWFENTASNLNERGITVLAPDRRGSGMNFRERGHLSSYRVLLADIEIMLAELTRDYPEQPLILVGGCWGAKACAYMAREDYVSQTGLPISRLAGLALICPAIETIVDVSFGTKCGIAINHLSRAGTEKSFAIPLTPDMFTEDSKYLEFIENDRLRLREATADFFVESLKLTFLARAAATRIKMPLLVMQTDADRIVNAEKIKSWYGKSASGNKQIRVFKKAAHSLDFDSAVFDEYVSMLGDWLIERGRAA